VKQQPKIAGITCEAAQRAIALRAIASPAWTPDLGPDLPQGQTSGSPESSSPAPIHASIQDPARPLHSAAFDELFHGLDEEELAALLAADLPLIGKQEQPLDRHLDAAGLMRALRRLEDEAAADAPAAAFGSGAASTADAVRDARNEAALETSNETSNEALNEHLRQCRTCQAEMAASAAFFRALASEPGPEPSATLLARARQRLDATLDSCEDAGIWTRLTQRLSFTAGRMRAAPVLCSTLLFAGILAGGYCGYRAGMSAHNEEQSALLLAPPVTDAPSVVADVSSIVQDPQSGMVEVRYDRLVPDVLTAPATDPSIRELLMAATQNGVDPMVRNASLSLLAADCGPGTACAQEPVRSALLSAMKTDKTPEVRREAMAELQPYIADDLQVRDAVLDALMRDPSAAVRIEAVRLLQPVDVDSSVRQVLHTVAASDGDPSIRSASLAALRTSPPLQ
jgi:hypothetical protein